jgi:predicted Zn-dependent peptidase
MLGNGVAVFLRGRHTARPASVRCRYRVGSTNGHPSLTGTSHFVEQMSSKGPIRIGPYAD